MSLDTQNHNSFREQTPKKQTLLQTLHKEANWKCLILTLCILGCLSAISWCRLAVVKKVIVNFRNFPITSSHETSPCADGYLYIPVTFLIMLYLVYLVECWHCNTRIELSCCVEVSSVYEKIRQMKEALPVIWWKAICYHYVRRTRQITRYRNGESYTTTQIYYERINSHSSSSTFVFAQCGTEDISQNLIDLEQNPVTKVRFSKGFCFANPDAAQDFEEQRARFFQENERQDDYMEMREGLDLFNVNFKENLVAFADPDRLPWYISKVWFWVSSLLLLSWPLRIIIEYKTAYVHYQVTKLFGANYRTSNNVQHNWQASGTYCIHNVDSSNEIEQMIRNNNITIVPSYSEALQLANGDTVPRDATRQWNGVFRTSADSNGNIASVDVTRIPRDNSIRSFTERLRRGDWYRRRSWGFGAIRAPRSITTSISNGTLVHTPASSWLLAASPGCRPVLITQPQQNEAPPDYEEALRTCRPIHSFLRRSVTDRDIVGRRGGAQNQHQINDVKLVLPHVETAL